MKLRQKILSVLCAAALTAGLAAPALAAAPVFTDVAEKDWYYKDVQTAAEKGLMTGDKSGAFRPGAYVTRATVITTLWRLIGAPEAEGTAFPDVPEKHWAHDAAIWAKGAGIATGYADGRLGPDDLVTREQLAVFLHRFALNQSAVIAEGVVDLYPDAQYISPWALVGMKHALGAGLMTGTSAGLSPLGLATRAELAVILVRLTTPVKG